MAQQQVAFVAAGAVDGEIVAEDVLRAVFYLVVFMQSSVAEGYFHPQRAWHDLPAIAVSGSHKGLCGQAVIQLSPFWSSSVKSVDRCIIRRIGRPWTKS